MGMFYRVQEIFNKPFLKSILIFLAALTLLSGSVVKMVMLKTEVPTYITGHSADSLLLAFNTVMCHKKSHLHNIYEPVTLIKELSQKDTGITSEPLFKAILKINKKNNLTEYCSTLQTPYLTSENTLSWLIQPIFKIHPSISFQGLIFTLFMIQISMLWFFFYYLAHMRVPGIYIFILSVVSISVSSTQMPYLIFTQYPLLLPALLFPIGFLGFSIHYQWYQKRVLHAVFCCLAGAYLFFLYNLRTTYIIPALAVFLVYYLFVFRSMKASLFKNLCNTLYPFSLMMISSVLCYILIQKSIFPPEFKKDKSVHLTTHPIAHPLVLSLAIPANDFAKKQGIEWNDAIGELIVSKIDPMVKFESPKYEQVLLTYYKSLWRDFPKDMLSLYYEKFKSAGHNFAQDNRLIKLFMFPLSKLNGIILFIIQFLFLYLLLKNRNKLTASFVFGTLSFSLAGLALYVESGIIYSVYNACYHAFLTFWLVSLNLGFLSLTLYGILSLSKKIVSEDKFKNGDSLSC